MKTNQFFSFALAGAVGGLLTLGGNLLFNHNRSALVNEANGTNSYAKNVNLTDGGPNGSPVNFTAAAERSMPAVVHIKTVETFKPRSSYEQRMMYFFGEPQPSVSFGSGVVINKDGYIVTNNHVVQGADGVVEVTTFDNRVLQAKVIATDPSTDLAVVKVESSSNLQPIEFANSDDVKVGQWTLAVGNPLNLASTVTAGIISAKGRDISIIQGQRALESFLQTDAAVNPGNSGGALVDLNGNLIGINTAIASPTGSYAGYAFAVPSNLVKKVVLDLIQFQTVKRGSLGVSIADINEEIAKNEKLDVREGVFVAEVLAGKGAESAGIREGDVITAVEGVQVKNSSELREKIGSRNPGDVVNVSINRNGAARNLRVTLN